jgi:ubiquinone/menaquinone biosynthesis C-methylase UbiE
VSRFDLVQNPFDETAEQYDAWFDSEEGRIIFVLEVSCLRSVMPPLTGRWFELGVGTGRFAAALGIGEGIDPSASMRALAERRGVRALDAVGERLPFADQDFDGVLMTTTVCFLRDLEASLRECYRVLKKTGQLVIGMIPADSPWGRLYERKAAEGHPVYSAATFYTSDDVIRLATSVGFEFAAGFSCLLAPPGSPAVEGSPREGVIEGAGFTALAFMKPVVQTLPHARGE